MDEDLKNTYLEALEQSQDRLLRICSSYADNSDDAKDLLQEVLVQIWKALPNFKGNSSLSTWMYRITLNVSLRYRENLHREKKRFSKLKSLTVEQIPSIDKDDINHRKLMFLRACVRALNEADKAVITLYLENLSYKEISSVTGLKENTVAVKIKRIKAKLLNCLNDKL